MKAGGKQGESREREKEEEKEKEGGEGGWGRGRGNYISENKATKLNVEITLQYFFASTHLFFVSQKIK